MGNVSRLERRSNRYVYCLFDSRRVLIMSYVFTAILIVAALIAGMWVAATLAEVLSPAIEALQCTRGGGNPCP